MNHYVPLFSKIVDSSLWSEPDTVIKVFLSMLAKKDKDDVVRGSAFAISQWARKSEVEVIEALKVLSSPDTKRIEPQPFDGRRIEKVKEGWLVLNGAYYQREMQKVNRREYLRVKKAEQRAREREVFERDAVASAPLGKAKVVLGEILQKAVEQSPELGAQLGVNPPSEPNLQKTVIQD